MLADAEGELQRRRDAMVARMERSSRLRKVRARARSRVVVSCRDARVRNGRPNECALLPLPISRPTTQAALEARRTARGPGSAATAAGGGASPLLSAALQIGRAHV